MHLNNIYKNILYKSNMAFAYHEAVFAKNGKMVDYIFLDVNPAFEVATGYKREDILGKRFLGDIAKLKPEAARWVDIYEQIFLSKSDQIVNDYSRELMGHYYVEVYPIDDRHFVTLLRRTSNEHKLESITSYFLDYVGKEVDYQLLTKMGLEFSGADYALFNLRDEKGLFVIKAVLGNPDKLNKLKELAHGEFLGRKWILNQRYQTITQNSSIVELDDLTKLIGNELPRTILDQMHILLNVGKIVLAEIRKDQKVLGNFIFIFEQGNPFIYSTYLSIYLKQLGVFIDKCNLEKTLNIKEREAAMLVNKSKKDILTNSYNRSVINTLLTDRLILCNRKKIKSYMAMVDIDNFKLINDSYGHLIGDAILRMFVDRVNHNLRKEDLLIRVGGDEFLIYLENIHDDEQAKEILIRLFSNVAEPYIVYDEESDTNLTIVTSLSAGISRFPEDGLSVKELMTKADYAMYGVKRTGKNDVAFYSSENNNE